MEQVREGTRNWVVKCNQGALHQASDILDPGFKALNADAASTEEKRTVLRTVLKCHFDQAKPTHLQHTRYVAMTEKLPNVAADKRKAAYCASLLAWRDLVNDNIGTKCDKAAWEASQKALHTILGAYFEKLCPYDTYEKAANAAGVKADFDAIMKNEDPPIKHGSAYPTLLELEKFPN